MLAAMSGGGAAYPSRACHFRDSQPSVTAPAMVLRSGLAAVRPWKRDILPCSSLTCQGHQRAGKVRGRSTCAHASTNSHSILAPLKLSYRVLNLLTHYVERVLRQRPRHGARPTVWISSRDTKLYTALAVYDWSTKSGNGVLHR